MAKSKSKNKNALPKWVKVSLWVLFTLFIITETYENRSFFRKVYRYLSYHYYKRNFKTTDFPVDYSIHGIDISHYQLFVDWHKLQSVDTYGDTIQFRFVLMKATEGLLIEDDMFDEHWERAKDNHFVRGAYHYFLPDRSAQVQAANYYTSVRLLPGDLPPVVDVEDLRGKSKAELVSCLRVFLHEIESHYHVRPIIYSNINFIEDYLEEDFSDYSFWIAHYYRHELNTDGNIKWVFWQHSDKASLLGIRTNVDANVFNGDEEDFQKLLIPNNISTP